jgi:transglutaminase-like putative cysteine protease/tetratricopeptide (TPR) repeat protein
MLGNLDSANTSYLTGQLVVWVGLLAGVLKCWSISRRPATNRKCALGLMFVLLAFLFATCVGTLAKIFGPSPALSAVIGLTGLGVFGALVTAIVLAIVGLVELSHRAEAFSQGRSQAVWTLVLAGMVGLVMGVGMVGAILRQQGFVAATGLDRPGKILTFDELNFQFRAPDRPWVSMDATRVNKDSKLTFMRRFPEAYFQVIAERIGSGVEFSSEQLAEVGKAHMKAGAASSRIISEVPWKMRGLNGVLVETEAVVANHELRYLQWSCATNGYAYQLIGYGRSEDQQLIAAELRQMFSRFEQIDANRVVSSGGFATNYSSPRYGYWVSLTNSPWHAYPSLQKNFPAAEFGASRGDSCFVVVPAWLRGAKLDREVLSSALLATFNVTYPNENLTRQKELSEGEYEGVQFDFEREMDGVLFRYRFKILQGDGNGFLIAAWTQRRAADADATLDDALARVRFDGRQIPGLTERREFTAGERKAQGFILNHAGLFHFNSGDHEKALSLFRAAARADDQESLYVLNTLQAWRHLDRPKEALDFLNVQSFVILKVPEVRAQQAYFQATASFTDQALTNYARLFAEGYRNDSHLAEYVDLLNLNRQNDLALAEVERYLKTGDSIRVRLLESEIYRLKGDFSRAISLLKAQREKAPFNLQIANGLAETSIQAGQYTDALEISLELLKNHADSALAYYLKGRSELGLKWYREAKASFEAAAKLAPANKDIASYLDHVSGLLGEGNNTLLKEPIEAVVLPTALSGLADLPIPDGYARSYGAYYTRRVLAVAYDRRKDYRTTDFMQARILDASGVAAFSSVQIPFDPLGEQVYVNEVRVMDASGKTISTGQVADYYVLDDRSSASASHKKVLNIPVPGLQPGCQLAVTITRRDLGHADGFPFLEHFFSRTVPVRDSVLFLSGDTAGLNYRTSPGVEVRTLPEGQYWRVVDPIVARWEPMQPPAASFLPTLWITDASAQWPVLASNYLASISGQLQLDETTARLAQGIVARKDSDELKIAALARYVQTNLTYKAIEFGRRARIPNKPAEILHNKYGDCKDHAVLLQQMLESVGVPAKLALVGHHGAIQKDLPSLDQFDHMIVYVPDQRTERFVDCTDKGADAARAIPFGLAGREGLVLDAQNPRFARIPSYSPNASTIDVQRRLKLVNATDIVAEEIITLTGVHAAYLRDCLLQMPTASQRTLWQRQLGTMDVELSEFKAESLEATDAPLQLRCAYTVKKQFHRSHLDLTGVLRAGFERSYLAADAVDHRLTPFEMMIPLAFHSTVSIDVPKGFRVEPPGNPAPTMDSRFVVCQGQAQLEGSKLKLEFESRQPMGEFKACDYAVYQDAMASALLLLEREVVFKPVGQ